MLIDCPGCAKSFHVARYALDAGGRSLACPHCAAVWYVAADQRSGFDLDPGDMPISAEAISRRAGENAALPPNPAAGGKDDTRPWRGLLPAPLLLLVIGLAAVMGGLGLRDQVVRLWPKASTAYAAIGLPVNLRGLTLRDVHTTLETAGLEPVLDVQGEITNLKAVRNGIPKLRLSLRDAQRRELYAWTTEAPKPQLASGESVRFHARLAAPPANARMLLVSFAVAARDDLALAK